MKVLPFVLALFLALAACEKAPKLAVPPSPSDQDALYADLPLPEGFRYVRNVSDRSPTGAFRVVNQTAEGKNRLLDQSAKFYREVYPRHGWTLEGEDRTDAGVTIVFVKKQERARVQLSKKDRATVFVRINVNRKD